MITRWHTALELRQQFYTVYSHLLSYQRHCLETQTANAAVYSGMLSHLSEVMAEYDDVKMWWMRDLRIYASDVKFLEMIMRATNDATH